MTNLYDFDKHKYLLSSSEWQVSVRSVKLSNATLCTGVFLFYIKRHLMSGNEFACSLGSSSAIIAWVWTQKTRWKTLANNVRRYSSRCVRAFMLFIWRDLFYLCYLFDLELILKFQFSLLFIFTFSYLAEAFIQSDLQMKSKETIKINKRAIMCKC